MAETTVKKLADVVGIPVDTLLSQMKEAGLPHIDAGEGVSDEQKQQLLAHLRKSHGAQDAEPKKITLKRRSTSTIKTTGAAGKAKTVNVEVRKKRTYVKRETVEEEERLAAEEEARRLAEEQARLQAEEEAKRKAEEDAKRKVEEEQALLREQEARARAELERKEEEARAGQEKTKRASVPKPAKKPLKEETAAERTQREAEERQQREAEETRRKQEAEARRKAEEEAARRTAEEAQRIAEELEKRAGEQPADAAKEEEEDKASSIVRDAVEAGYRTEERQSRRRRRKAKAAGVAHGQMKSSMNKQHGFKSPTEKMVYDVEIPETITVAELAQRMNIKSKELIRSLVKMGEMATVNQYIDQETAVLLTEEMGHNPITVKGQEETLEDDLATLADYSGIEAVERAPVVTIMGHVDHGKTSLLDYIRRAKVAAGEAGGITQHIGAYHVKTAQGMVSFLDTPGHAAFTAMRARGAQCTDIVILVVAADDGVMPQTKEAVQHARSAGVPLVVAINKMDKEEADPDRVKTELAGMEVIPEDWGGDVQFVPISAHTGEGIDELLESLILQAEILELEASPDAPAKGIVIESSLERGRGSVATVLVQNGTLNKGDMVVAGSFFGKVRAMTDEAGKQTKEAGPSIPVEILGLNGTPNAGDEFFAVADEKKAKELAEFRQVREREQRLQRQQAAKLENLFENMGKDDVKTLNVVLKTDVRGSLEAITKSLQDLGNDEVQVKMVSSGVGGIAETDVSLAMATNAVIFGFNVRADASAKRLVEQEGLDLRYYSIIYNLIDDVKAALTGMLAPEFREDIIGIADVRDVFRSPKFGQVAGCMVTEGNVHRNKPIRVLRDNVVIFEGELESLRRFKDDVADVRSGMECGIGVKGYDVKVGDQIEVFDRVRVERKLESTGA
jgi:translation initiation factor IF-2